MSQRHPVAADLAGAAPAFRQASCGPSCGGVCPPVWGWPRRLRHVRKHLHLTPAGLAAYLSERPNVSEVSPRQVRAWKQGREVPPYAVHRWIGYLEHRAWSQRLQRIRFAAAPLRTQIRMARRLGVPLGTYHAWDAGCHAPSPEYRARIEPTLAYLERLIAERDGQAGQPPDAAA